METSKFGLCFKLNENDLSASIVNSSNAIGSMMIPKSITFNSKDYIIKSINKNAFQNNKNIQSINFSEDSELLTIDQDSFIKSSIESISLPSSLKELKEGWCNGASKLTKVTISPKNDNFLIDDNNDFIIGKSNSKSEEFDILLFARRNIEHVIIPPFIKCIGSHCFDNCTKIKSFEFSEDSKIESINDSAFNNSSIKSIEFPQNLKHLNKGWCKNLNKLRKISICSTNKNFSISNNGKFLMGKSDTNNSIFDVLLYAYRDSQKVEIPKYVKYIGHFAFYHCLNIKSVTFPKNSEVVSIGENAFSYISIEKVSFPSKLEEIGDFSFYMCQNLKTIEFPSDSIIHTIGKESFSHSKIERIFIPKSVKNIGDSSFYYCRNLKTPKYRQYSFHSTKIESIQIPKKVTEIGEECFSRCSDLKSIEFQSDSNLKIIGKSAFCEAAIENITIPPSVQKIGSFAFGLCYSLKSVTFSEDSELQTFESCIFSETIIEKVSIPPKLIECENEWVNKTLNLNTISVINNDRFKFVDDKYLVYKSNEKSDIYDSLLFVSRDIENAVIPSYIQRICTDSFSDCVWLQKVEFSENSKLRVIEKNSFSFSSVEIISLPSTVEEISEFAFYSCQNLRLIQNFENLQIKKIEPNTFSLTNLESITIPAKVVELKDFWCDGLHHLNRISVSSENSFFSFINDSLLVGKTDENSDVFDCLLFSRRDIEKIIIPSFIRFISPNTFYECRKIKSIKFEKKSNLGSIGQYAFSDSFIDRIVIPSSAKKIDEFAFSRCKFKSFEFDSNSELEIIEQNAFYENSFAHAMIIPSKVNFIEDHAFYSSNLKYIEFLCEFVTFGNDIFNYSTILLLSFPNTKKVTNFKNFLFNFQGNTTLFIQSNAIIE